MKNYTIEVAFDACGTELWDAFCSSDRPAAHGGGKTNTERRCRGAAAGEMR